MEEKKRQNVKDKSQTCFWAGGEKNELALCVRVQARWNKMVGCNMTRMGVGGNSI